MTLMNNYVEYLWQRCGLDKEIAPAPLLHSPVFIYTTMIPYHAVERWRTEMGYSIVQYRRDSMITT
jgi:hypothetical protein